MVVLALMEVLLTAILRTVLLEDFLDDDLPTDLERLPLLDLDRWRDLDREDFDLVADDELSVERVCERPWRVWADETAGVCFLDGSLLLVVLSVFFTRPAAPPNLDFTERDASGMTVGFFKMVLILESRPFCWPPLFLMIQESLAKTPDLLRVGVLRVGDSAGLLKGEFMVLRRGDSGK